MDVAGRRLWQQAGGDTNRNYAELCLKWDVILNGPGYAGPWPGCREELEGSWSPKKLTDLGRFADEMQDGDLVVLKVGTTDVHGVGEVVGEYQYHDEFGDVDGWDLQHVRRVRWLWRPTDGPARFDTYALKFGDTTQRLIGQSVIDWLHQLEIPEDAWDQPLVELPAESTARDVTTDGIARRMFDTGIASTSINALVDQMGELTRVAQWYRRTKRPSEHETVAYLVVPLLRALGWTPQRMAVEWKRLDVALFDRLPREDASVRVVVEAKRMDQSCLTARSQALRYAQGKPRCERLVVTDGIRWGIYLRPESGDPVLHAYLNLWRPRTAYPVYGCKGASDALAVMTPDWEAGFDPSTQAD